MTKEEIIELAKQAGFVDYELDDGTTNAFDKRYEAFAKLVADKEREACAKLCDLAMLQNQEAINELEDIDINITWNENSMRDFGKDELNFARAIEAKLKEKNTQKTTGENNLSSD